MSQVTKVHGDYKQVAVFDAGVTSTGAGSSTGLNAVTTGVTVQPQGPKLDFFTIEFDGAATGATVNTAIQTLQQLATVYIYEYTDTTDDTLAVAIYPVAAWTAAGIDTALAAAGVAGTTTTASATFTG